MFIRLLYLLFMFGLATYCSSVLAQETTNYVSKTPPNDQLVLKRASDMSGCGGIVEIVGRFTESEKQSLIIGKKPNGGWVDMQLMRFDDNRWLLTCGDMMGGRHRGFIVN